MTERAVPIVNRLGLHARPAAEFVKVAARFACEVKVRKDSMEVNGKSIMGMMMLAAEQGSALIITVNGDDGAQALDALEALIRAGFGEE
ncbi:MAG: phosphocarrier protein HPr [Gemmatimonadetes bacterium GWC2_71_10]|nr:MAG: phosphocarrier protein HPr [Gemmatimonadetes bacterium GWC2_71_10]